MSHQDREFDVIVIGGGTAGLVIANRLSEDPNLQVLIVEAGANHNNDPNVQNPAFMKQLWGTSDTDWCYKTVPQAELNNRVLTQTHGKVLGGSSAVNALATIYPSMKMFDIWTKLGNFGWDAETMSSYYKKFQTFHPPSHELEKELSIDYMDYNLYGKTGPVQTSIRTFNMEFSKAWSETFANLYGRVKTDPISGAAVGSFTCANYIDPASATRSHAGVAYYDPISTRPNLHLVENALVEKVLLSKQGDGPVKAIGVQYLVNSERQVSIAKREVVLCAGAYNSPMILELSGIGDDQLLKSLGIDVIISNPNVGGNLQDHPVVIQSVELANDKDSLDSLSNPELFGEALQQFQEHKSGPLSSGFNSHAFLPVTTILSPAENRAFEDLVVKKRDSLQGISNAHKIQIDHIASILLDPKDSTAFLSSAAAGFSPEMIAQGIKSGSLVTALVHPLSRGSCHIQSSDPLTPPLIDPKYLSHPLDVEVLAQHALHMSKMISIEPLASIIKPNGKGSITTGSLENIAEAIKWTRETATNQFHPCGTCAMMSKELDGVVNDKLIVHGTANLRVIDASIFPLIPEGPITSTVYAVAERAADLIKEDLKKGIPHTNGIHESSVLS